MSSSSGPAEHILDAIRISPDQFQDCATSLIHTILLNRTVDTVVSPVIIPLDGLDIDFASAETPQSAAYISERLAPMQDAVFAGMKEAWIILSLGHSVPKKSWFRETQAFEVWEQWCISFTFGTVTAADIREAMLHTVTQITMQANAAEVPRAEPGASFKYTINLPTDKDWGSSKEFIKLIRKVVSAPPTIIQ